MLACDPPLANPEDLAIPRCAANADKGRSLLSIDCIMASGSTHTSLEQVRLSRFIVYCASHESRYADELSRDSREG